MNRSTTDSLSIYLQSKKTVQCKPVHTRHISFVRESSIQCYFVNGGRNLK